MDKMADLVFNLPLDQETIDIIESIRKLRLWMAKNMMNSLTPTVEQMISRGIIDEGDRARYRSQLAVELKKKIEALEKRLPEDGPIYSDELELYLKILGENNEITQPS